MRRRGIPHIAPLLALGFALCLVVTAAIAEPDLREAPRTIEEVQFYPDDSNPGLFYYFPGTIELATELNGKPKLRFLQMRYVGNATYGTEGESGSASTLTLPMHLNSPSPVQLKRASVLLRAIADRKRVELRPLPITRFEALLAFAPVGEDGPEESQLLPSGQFESELAKESQTTSKTFWRDRVYTLEMNEATSQLVWKALHDDLGLISVGYVFYSEGVTGPTRPELDVKLEGALPPVVHGILAIAGLVDKKQGGLADGFEAFSSDLQGKLQAEQERIARQASSAERMVSAGVATIHVDAKRWPDLFTRIDFNEELPPGYATIQIYCYDFHNQLRTDLSYKKVELEATSVAGTRVSTEAKFFRNQRDVYSTRVHFPVAVRLTEPYRYRVIAARRSGEKEIGEWQSRDVWGGIVDITARSNTVPGDAADLEAEG